MSKSLFFDLETLQFSGIQFDINQKLLKKDILDHAYPVWKPCLGNSLFGIQPKTHILKIKLNLESNGEKIREKSNLFTNHNQTLPKKIANSEKRKSEIVNGKFKKEDKHASTYAQVFNPKIQNKLNSPSRLSARISSILKALEENTLEPLLIKCYSELSMADFKSILVNLGKMGHWNIALQIFNHRLRHEKFKKDLSEHELALLLRILEKNGQPQLAFNLFNKCLMQEKGLIGVYSFNSMINTFAKIQKEEECMRLYEQMINLKLKPNNSTYCIILNLLFKQRAEEKTVEAFMNEIRKRRRRRLDSSLHYLMVKAYSMVGNDAMVEQLMEEMKEEGLSPSANVFNFVIVAYARAGRLDKAREMLTWMKENGHPPSVLNYNELITWHVRKGMVDEAKELMEEMKRNDMQPDFITYTVILSALERAELYADVEKIYLDLKLTHSEIDVNVYNVMINMYGKREMMQEMMSCYHDMDAQDVRPDIITWNTIIQAFGRMKDGVSLNSIVKEMKESGIAGDASTCDMLIDAYARCGYLEISHSIYLSMPPRFPRTSATFAAMLAGFARAGQWEETERVMEDMRAQSVNVDEFAYVTLLQAYANGKNLDGLDALADKIESDVLFPDSSKSTLLKNVLVKSFCKCRAVSSAEKQYADLREKGRSIDIVTFNSMLALYGKLGEMEKVAKILDDVAASGVRLSLASFNCLIGIYGRYGEASHAVDAFHSITKQGMTPNQISFNSIVLALCKSNRMEDACEYLLLMIQQNIKPENYIFETFVKSYESVGCHEKAKQIKNMIRKFGKTDSNARTQGSSQVKVTFPEASANLPPKNMYVLMETQLDYIFDCT